MREFREGDLVWHRHKVEAGKIFAGRVIGFGPDHRRWIRVRGSDDRNRVWLADHLLNVTLIVPEWEPARNPLAR
jgi:hypothetical protein